MKCFPKHMGDEHAHTLHLGWMRGCAGATILRGLGVPLHVGRDVLGRSTVKTSERYTHAMVQPQRDALEKLGELTRKLTNTG